MKTTLTLLAFLGVLCGQLTAVDAPKTWLRPTLANVPYGTHKQHVLDFYQAKSENKPTPVVFFIHGGGWYGGNKLLSIFWCADDFREYVAAGISVVSINYRFIKEAEADKVVPPVKGPLHDAARALQFVRSKAAEWNIDKPRIGGMGDSAGACSALWLAFHADLADPKSDDPIARESTRLWWAALTGAQTSLDPQQMREWTPNCSYGGHAFGFKTFGEFLAQRETILPWIAEYSPYALVTAAAPPIYLRYFNYRDTSPALGQNQKDPTHTPNFGVKLQEKCQSMGIECELVYPGAPDVKHASLRDYLIERRKAAKK